MLPSNHAAWLQDQSTITSPPMIEATASLGPQTTDRPMEPLPSHALVPWWKEAAMEIIREDDDFDLITRTIKYIPGNTTTAATLLSRRPEEWLCAFLKFLCGDGAALRCDGSPFSTAELIVTIIRPGLLQCAPRLVQSTFITALRSDTRTAAGNLDFQIHMIFSRTTFLDWTAWVCGYQCAFISDFLDAVSIFRDDLARSAQEDTLVAQNLELLQKEWPTKQPLVRWIIEGAISCDASFQVSEALRLFLEPIAEQFKHPSISSLDTANQLKEWCFSISSITHKLAILETQFRLKIVHQTDPKWPTPLSADFSLWESIQSQNPQDMAESSTQYVTTIFLQISTADLLSEVGYLQDIARDWSDLADDFLACLSADRTKEKYLMDLANHFIHLGNLFSATAIGLALQKWGYQDSTSWIWMIINPREYFSGCRKFVTDNPACLVPLLPYIRDLRLSRNAPEKVLGFHERTVAFLQRAGGGDSGLHDKTKKLETGMGQSDSELSKKLEGKQLETGTTGNQYLPYQAISSSFSGASQRMKGTAVHSSMFPLYDSLRHTLPRTCIQFHPHGHRNSQAPLWHEQLRGRSTSNSFKGLPKTNSPRPRKRSLTTQLDGQPPQRTEKKGKSSNVENKDIDHHFGFSRLQNHRAGTVEGAVTATVTAAPRHIIRPGLKSLSIPLPRGYIYEIACTSLEELWTVEIQPDVLVDSSITLPHAARNLLGDIASQLNYYDRLLLCCVKWEFNANEVIDRSWAFYFGQEDQDFSNPVQRYNTQTGDQMTTELASSRFAQIKRQAETRVSEKYSHSMNVARTFLQLKVPLHNVDRVDYLCDQVYNFCFACLKHPNFDLDCHLLRYWYWKRDGWFDAFYSIPELKRMTANSEHLITSAHLQRAFKVATVAYCGLVLEADRIHDQTLQVVIVCLQSLSKSATLRDLPPEEFISRNLDDYIKNLRRQLLCRVVPSDVKHTINERLLPGGGSDVKSDEEEIRPDLDYSNILDIMQKQNQGRLIMEEKRQEKVMDLARLRDT